MRLPAEFSDDRFLDAFRDILRDTLTTATITVLLVITVKRLFPGPDLVDVLFLLILLPVFALILWWYRCILNRSIMTLEDMFKDSRYFDCWRHCLGASGIFFVFFIAYTVSSAIASH